MNLFMSAINERFQFFCISENTAKAQDNRELP